MNHLISVLPLFLTLILCVLNGFSMSSYRVSMKKAALIFAVMTLLCFAANSYIIIFWGRAIFHDVMLFTVAVPYFCLFLLLSKDKISQTFFNFWLWINIYALISNTVMWINDISFRRFGFEVTLRILLFCVYFVLYHKYLRASHRRIIETLDVNWWLFSTVPLFFTILIVTTNKQARIPEGFSRNYPLLLVLFVLMLLVYAIIFYTFRKVNAAMQYELAQTVYSQQLDAAKDQIACLNEVQMQTAIYRHNMRHNLTTIDAFLSTGKVQQARDYIQEVQQGIDDLTLKRFCQNELVNLLCSSFSNKAERKGVQLTVDANLPEELQISDMELCAILSNGLENAFHAVSELDASLKWTRLYCAVRANNLLIEIKNPCAGEIPMRDGLPVSCREGHGYGCRSIQAIAQQHRGLTSFRAENGVFVLRVVLPIL